MGRKYFFVPESSKARKGVEEKEVEEDSEEEEEEVEAEKKKKKDKCFSFFSRDYKQVSTTGDLKLGFDRRCVGILCNNEVRVWITCSGGGVI